MPDRSVRQEHYVVTAAPGQGLARDQLPVAVEPGEFAGLFGLYGAVVQHQRDALADRRDRIDVAIGAAAVGPRAHLDRLSNVERASVEPQPHDRLARGVDDAEQLVDHRDLVALVVEPLGENGEVGQPPPANVKTQDSAHVARAGGLVAGFEQINRIVVSSDAEEKAPQKLLDRIAPPGEKPHARRDQTVMSGERGIDHANLSPAISFAGQRMAPSAFRNQ